MPLRLNKQGLINLIDQIEADGGDASELRHELEALEPDHNSRIHPRRQVSRFNDEEELTTADRLSFNVGDLFENGISEELMTKLVELDMNHSLKELKAMCVKAGLSAGGDKKELAAKLVSKGIL